MDVTSIVAASALVGALTGAGGVWVALRRDGREERTQAITEAGETIKLLKEQTDILKDHGEKREGRLAPARDVVAAC